MDGDGVRRVGRGGSQGRAGANACVSRAELWSLCGAECVGPTPAMMSAACPLSNAVVNQDEDLQDVAF